MYNLKEEFAFGKTQHYKLQIKVTLKLSTQYLLGQTLKQTACVCTEA